MKPIIITLLALCVCPLLHSQSIAEKAVQKLDSFSLSFPQEKVFVQTDRSQYVAGETIWFAAYALADNKPSYLSKVVYVEIANALGRVIEKRMLPLTRGAGQGEIALARDLPTGTYSLNAYTLWMLNFPAPLFSRRITVFNTDTKTAGMNPKAEAFLIGFFPEGGDLVSGLKNRVAVKAMQPNGQPLEVKGEVLDQKNAIITSFSTVHDGMGVFEMEPKPGERYTVRIAAKEGGTRTLNLPAAKDEGIVLQVINENPSRLFVQIQKKTRTPGALNAVYIVAQVNGESVYAAQLKLEEGTTTLPMAKKDLPAGVMQLTVFSESGQPLAERLAFISNHSLEQPELVITEENHQPRKKNQLALDLRAYKNPMASVSVVNLSVDSSNQESNILAATYLTADLGSNIHNPGFYFRDKEPATLRALDLLLMTQGWRRFQWQDLMADRYPKLNYPVESGITVTGKLTKVNGKSQVTNGRIDFITKAEDSTTMVTTVRLNKEDEFFIPDLHFKKAATIYYQGTNEDRQKSLTNVEVYPSYYDTLAKSRVKQETDPDAILNVQTQGMEKLVAEKKQLDEANNKLLPGVTVRAKRPSVVDSLNKLYVTDLFINSDQTIPMDKGQYYSVWQFLQRNIAGLDVGRNQYGETTVFFSRYAGLDVFTGDIGGDSNTNIRFYLNEVEVSKDIIETVNPMDIALVKVFKGTTAMMLGAGRGAIGIYTQKGAGGRDWRSKAFNSFKKQGYSVTREFYNLDYGVLNPESSFGDIRPTLYWTPLLKTDSSGKGIIKFYNDDLARSFRVVINGVDENGKLIFIEKIMR